MPSELYYQNRIISLEETIEKLTRTITKLERENKQLQKNWDQAEKDANNEARARIKMAKEIKYNLGDTY